MDAPVQGDASLLTRLCAVEARLAEVEARTRLPELLPLPEAAARSGLNLSWLKLQVEMRTLAHMRIGKTIYVKVSGLEKCIERFTIEARASSAA